MKVIRRALAALALAALFAAGLRVRGRGGTPPQHGGWRPLDLPPEPVSDAPRTLRVEANVDANSDANVEAVSDP